MISSKQYERDLTERGIDEVRKLNRDKKRRKVTFFLEAGRCKDVRIELAICD